MTTSKFLKMATPSDLRTHAIILRRTNYGESDRILNLLTPEGKVSALARGVRKEKSRLAGGIELFTIADVVIHRGHTELGTLTSAKMLRFFNNILTDMARLELAAAFMKRFERLSEQVTSSDYFEILSEILAGLDSLLPVTLVETWGLFNLARASGEDINLIYDINGEKLDENSAYHWENSESALRQDSHGDISAKEIKFARFLLGHKLTVAAKVDHYEELLPPLLSLAKILNYW